jgi:hypothetical protein
MEFSKKRISKQAIEFFLIIVLAALAYLPNITRASIYRDDWYYVLDRTIGGPGAFQEMFSIDRPARGPFFEVFFQLLGVEPLPYHLSSFLWRLLGGFAAYYLFKIIWPNQKRAALFMGLLFMLFPGYSRWLEGFENQPRIFSSLLEVISIALTLKAIQASQLSIKVAAWVASFVTGWAYIALVDFSFGMEFFRLLCVYLLVSHAKPELSFLRKSFSALRAWMIAAIIPAGFLFWRLFIFHNARPTTDVGLQLSFLVDSPLHTGLLWLIRLVQSSLNVSVLAWTMPPAQTIFNYQVSEIIVGLAISALAAAVLIIALTLLDRQKTGEAEVANNHPGNWQIEAIVIGFLGVIVGVLPVVMANRFATLGNYSHYALPASLASAALVGGVVYSITSTRVRLGFMSGLVFLAVLSHYAISLRIIHEETTISNFWQQVLWRAPGIKAGTTLFVNYPGVDYGQDVDTVAGPATYLYYPDQTNQLPALYPISALEQGENSSKDILENPGKTYTFRYRTHTSDVNYSNLLVISQPAEASCVHVMDSNWPRTSISDPQAISLVSSLSKITQIQTEGISLIPDKAIFGVEPTHNWCYYYQKAELALQKGDWEQIVNLGDDAIKLDLRPSDPVEWMPFIQAYAFTGNNEILPKLAKAFKQEPLYQKQACKVLLRMDKNGLALSLATLDEVNRLFCSE